MTAIVHATGIVTMTAILGLVVRGVAAHTRAVLRELNILLVIILTGRKRLTAPTSLAMIRELTGAGHVPAAGKIQRAAGTQKAGRTEPGEAITGPTLRRRISRTRSELPEAMIDAKSA